MFLRLKDEEEREGFSHESFYFLQVVLKVDDPLVGSLGGRFLVSEATFSEERRILLGHVIVLEDIDFLVEKNKVTNIHQLNLFYARLRATPDTYFQNKRRVGFWSSSYKISAVLLIKGEYYARFVDEETKKSMVIKEKSLSDPGCWTMSGNPEGI